jgi:spermidine/putrescine transport system ATP-binding protein
VAVLAEGRLLLEAQPAEDAVARSTGADGVDGPSGAAPTNDALLSQDDPAAAGAPAA